ncbi:MAG TPA: hypothetical protein VHL34_15245 [Rhizomicrobium sp.]|jgi:hypothetical protein|nr:hypothetical protein [Rhizomicrobium sp.]
MRLLFRAALASAAWLVASYAAPAAAIDYDLKTPVERPDPASIVVPDLTFKAIARDYWRYDSYFIFHKDGVSYEQAFAELDQCRIYSLSARTAVTVHPFVPLGGEVEKRDYTDRPRTGNGLVGSMMEDAMIENEWHYAVIATFRRCMYFKGYARYGTSERISKLIDAGTDAERLARLALIASGPKPTSGAVVDP